MLLVGDADSGAQVRKSWEVLGAVVERGFDHWVITYSGGKDSTAALVLSLEALLEGGLQVQRVDVIYADTLIENPVMEEQALGFLGFLAGEGRLSSLPLHFHVVHPKLEERYWVCLLGRGYPPPNRRFRWCTKRLKIEPAEERLRSCIEPGRTVIVTGARYGESSERDRRLRTAGEVWDHAAWLRYNPQLRAIYLAPIVSWREEDVWDFLNHYAPLWGYPTDRLEREVYGGRGVRFGCWMCTVVKRDSSMERLVERREWAHLRPLLEFREYVLRRTSTPQSRYLRPDGKPGRLTLEVRKELLGELLRLQDLVSLRLINEEEVEFIEGLWQDPRYGAYRRSEERKTTCLEPMLL